MCNRRLDWYQSYNRCLTELTAPFHNKGITLHSPKYPVSESISGSEWLNAKSTPGRQSRSVPVWSWMGKTTSNHGYYGACCCVGECMSPLSCYTITHRQVVWLKEIKEMRKCGLEYAQCLCFSHTHTHAWLSVHSACDQSLCDLSWHMPTREAQISLILGAEVPHHRVTSFSQNSLTISPLTSRTLAKGNPTPAAAAI